MLRVIEKKERSGEIKYGFADEKGEIIIPCIYEDIGMAAVGDEEGGPIPVKRNGKWGYMDRTGKTFLPCRYDSASCFYYPSECAIVTSNGKYGLIDKDGCEVISCQYSHPFILDNRGHVKVKQDGGKWGLIDITTGKRLLPFKYDNIDVFREGLAKIEQNGKWGFIEETGEEICPCKYDCEKGLEDKAIFDEICDDMTNDFMSNIKNTKSEEKVEELVQRYRKLLTGLIVNRNFELNSKEMDKKQKNSLQKLNDDAIGAIDKICSDAKNVEEGLNND